VTTTERPTAADAIRNAMADHRAGRSEAAAARLAGLLSRRPEDPALLRAAIAVASDRGRHEETIALCARALALDPDQADLVNARGVACLARGRHAEAIRDLTRAVELDPDSGDGWFNLGCAFQAGRAYDRAVDAYRKARALSPKNLRIYNNLGVVFQILEKKEDAVACFRDGLRIAPREAQLLVNLGGAYRQFGDTQAAVDCFRRAIDVDPEIPGPHFALATTYLRAGDFAAGFAEYEWRWKMPGGHRKAPPGPAWDGATAPDKTILLYHEQGHGDTILFARFIAAVRNRVGRVVVDCQRPLAHLLATVAGVDAVGTGQAGLTYHTHAALGSLPCLLGTRVDTIPAEIPYVHADPGQSTLWAERLAGPGFKVGLVWAGNPQHHRDAMRSMRLADLAPLGEIPGAMFHGLQFGPGRDQPAEAAAGLRFTDLAPILGDFADMAALMMNLDLVITVDTAAAHLAGALARPVWTLLDRESDWRWFVDRSDSPWYPTMRLFRQKRAGDWAPVVAEVRAALQSLVQQRQSS
jgi:tetratricopeptide (TPR) repeat protein